MLRKVFIFKARYLAKGNEGRCSPLMSKAIHRLSVSTVKVSLVKCYWKGKARSKRRVRLNGTGKYTMHPEGYVLVANKRILCIGIVDRTGKRIKSSW